MAEAIPDPYDSWACYHAALARGEDRSLEFFPSPDEIKERIAVMHELYDLGFNNHFICSVMVHDTPTLEVVRRMIDAWGPAETYRRCRPFLAATEYNQ